MTVPRLRSDLATSTSTVAICGGGGGATGGGADFAARRQIRGDAAGGDSDTEYHETRGFHYASLPT